MLAENRNMQAVSAVVLCIAAALPSYFGLYMVSYALGRPDSPRFVIGLFALAALALTAFLLDLAGTGLSGAGCKIPPAIPMIGAIAIVPLVVMSLPLQYDENLPTGIVVLAMGGVIVGGTSLATRSNRQARPFVLSLLGAFYLVCVLMDLLRR